MRQILLVLIKKMPIKLLCNPKVREYISYRFPGPEKFPGLSRNRPLAFVITIQLFGYDIGLKTVGV